MLGSGVTSLPYHHPLMVANRFVQLDHMSRGRTMLGCGPGALPSDAYMMGIEPSTQRDRMEQSLAAIMQLPVHAEVRGLCGHRRVHGIQRQPRIAV